MQKTCKYLSLISISGYAVFYSTAVFAAEEHAKAEGNGFPQLDMSTYASQVFWLVIAFSSLYLLMAKAALPKVGEVLDRREKTREENLISAEKDQEKMEDVKSLYEEKLKDAHNKSQDLLAKTAIDLKALADKENVEFSDNARKRLKISEQKIEKAKIEALTEISDISAEIAVEAFKKITTAKITKTQAKKAVKEALKASA